MERMSTDQFAIFIGKSKQLITHYTSMGMPKTKEGRMCKYDANECMTWAFENNHMSFAHAIQKAIENDDPSKDATNYPPNFETNKKKRQIPYEMVHDDAFIEDEVIEHPEGSTAEPIKIKINKIEKLKDAFNNFITCLEDIINEKEAHTTKKRN
jgi:hypothetical protein